MYFSKMTLDLRDTDSNIITNLVERGDYFFHQALWDVFQDAPARSFLYRREDRNGQIFLYVLSETCPKESNVFIVQTKEFSLNMKTGTKLSFSLRANPTVSRQGKRCDVFMDTKHRMRQEGMSNYHADREEAAKDWLKRQAQNSGFKLSAVSVDRYCQKKVIGKQQLIQFSTIDYSGTLVVTDPGLFLAKLRKGFGREKAFGCGLMLIRRS